MPPFLSFINFTHQKFMQGIYWHKQSSSGIFDIVSLILDTLSVSVLRTTDSMAQNCKVSCPMTLDAEASLYSPTLL